MPDYARSAAAQAAYEVALKEMRLQWCSVEDMIRVRVLGWKRQRGADGKSFAERPVCGGWRRRALEPNLFPYEVPRGIEHWVLWSEEPMSRDAVERHLERTAPTWASGWSWVRNPPAARSVPGLWHVQVFFRRKEGI
jgi:hypothetical protein